ncbi:hypothetical protein [Aureibaculum conchae]|uniref:hypothetical protein n=1 Tax=Aureibaculum sp. 2308TA14-22 TaxID=3108392 RepID=UPI00339317B0
MEIDIDKIITKFRDNSLSSQNEEDVRINTNIFLDSISDFYGLNKTFSSEVSSLQGGRADSIYSDVIFEFKKPKKFKSQVGEDEAIYGRDDKDRGLYSYLVNFSLDELGKGDDGYFEQILLSKVGVAFDGKTFIFFRYKKGTELIDLLVKKKTKKFPKQKRTYFRNRKNY